MVPGTNSRSWKTDATFDWNENMECTCKSPEILWEALPSPGWAALPWSGSGQAVGAQGWGSGQKERLGNLCP